MGVGMEGDGGEGNEAAGLLLERANSVEVVDALGEGLAEAEDHGGGGAEAELVGGAVGFEPVVLLGHVGGDESVVAGEGVEAGAVEAGEGAAQAEAGGGRQGGDGGCRKTLEAERGVALAQAREQGAELVEVGDEEGREFKMDAGASEVERFGRLGVEGFGRCGVDAGDGDAAIDQIADHAFGVEGAADGVGLHADADEVVGVEAVESLCGADAHPLILPFAGSSKCSMGAWGKVGREWAGFGGCAESVGGSSLRLRGEGPRSGPGAGGLAFWHD